MIKSRIKQRLREQKTKVSMELYKRFRIEILQYLTQSGTACDHSQIVCLLRRVRSRVATCRAGLGSCRFIVFEGK